MPYSKVIGYRENENAEYDARDLVALLDLFNVKQFPNNGNEYPVRAYAQKGETLAWYIGHSEQYEVLRPILRDILVLHDVINQTAPGLHNKKDGGKAAKLAFVRLRSAGPTRSHSRAKRARQG